MSDGRSRGRSLKSTAPAPLERAPEMPVISAAPGRAHCGVSAPPKGLALDAAGCGHYTGREGMMHGAYHERIEPACSEAELRERLSATGWLRGRSLHVATGAAPDLDTARAWAVARALIVGDAVAVRIAGGAWCVGEFQG